MPSGLPDFQQAFVATFERRVLFEWIARKEAMKIFYDQRFILGFNFHFQISKGPKKQWRVDPMVAPILNVFIRKANQLLAFDAVPISFFSFLINQSLSITKLYNRMSTITQSENGISIAEFTLVKQYAN